LQKPLAIVLPRNLLTMEKKAIIIGAGPAGLTAAYELLKRTDITPVILERSGHIGGISKTIEYKGNRMDIGGHRFFSKSDRVMNWWLQIMPLHSDNEEITIQYQNKSTTINHTSASEADSNNMPGKAMLVRKRLSRIYFLRKFFTYPLQLSFDTLRKLGLFTTIRILFSYLYVQLFPCKPEKSLEDFLINRFGQTLYKLFFKDYTEKVWGVPCHQIPASWGAQRIKGVSIGKALQHAAAGMINKGKKKTDIAQQHTETSLIEQFLYPALGPGQLWEEVARQVQSMGGTILLYEQVKEIQFSGNQITGVVTENTITRSRTQHNGDYYFSTMPVKDLIEGMNGHVPAPVKEIAAGLQYRDFIIVGVLLKQLTADLKDTWIYIQDSNVKAGRLQLFNNWSPYMVHTPGTVWIGMEYFCNKGDAFWNMSDEEIERTAIEELEKMGLAQVLDVLDSTVHREEKTYPAYFGTYEQFEGVRNYVDQFDNLFLVGRNGMHKYNNADHSMLTAMTAVDNIIAGVTEKANIWAINTEQEYHEEKPATSLPAGMVGAANPPPSFTQYLFRNKINKWTICIAGLLAIIQFVIFKMLYPYASFMPDSGAYIEAAQNNYVINFWPIGYSWFLRCFHVFFQSDTALVLFQYLLLQGSALGFVFTLFYFVEPGRIVRYVLPAFFVLNPLFLVTANYVSSDALFITLSFIWATQLLWLIYRPSSRLLLFHVCILFLAFIVRFNSLYYPLISAVVIIASKLRLNVRLAGIGLSFLLIAVFGWYSSNQYKAITGERQFAAFAGWQLAGNALYAYSHGNEKIEKVPAQFSVLHKMVNRHIDSLSRVALRPDSMPGIYYQWKGPLEQYFKYQFPGDTNLTNFKHYASLAPLYKAYGTYLIKQQPQAYVQHFLWPNLIRFYVPSEEFLGQYNIYNQVNDAEKRWFGYNKATLTGYSKEFKVVHMMPVVSAGINLLFVGGLVGFIMLGGLKKAKKLSPVLLLITALWIANMGFSVLASPIVLRYQLFTMSMIFGAGVLLLEFIYNSDSMEISLPQEARPVSALG
jgi:protoporphyrinogen oxidase